MLNSLVNDLVMKINQQLNRSSVIDTTHIKSIVSTSLQQLDLVSREEFDAQSIVLERTQRQVDELLKKVESLENDLPSQE